MPRKNVIAVDRVAVFIEIHKGEKSILIPPLKLF
jgi:hypothetical protein